MKKDSILIFSMVKVKHSKTRSDNMTLYLRARDFRPVAEINDLTCFPQKR